MGVMGRGEGCDGPPRAQAAATPRRIVLRVGAGAYDVTEWAPRHPGGRTLLERHCDGEGERDAADAFEAFHPPGGRARAMLAAMPRVAPLEAGVPSSVCAVAAAHADAEQDSPSPQHVMSGGLVAEEPHETTRSIRAARITSAFRALRKELELEGYFEPSAVAIAARAGRCAAFAAAATVLLLGAPRDDIRSGYRRALALILGALMLGMLYAQGLLFAHDILHLSVLTRARERQRARALGWLFGTVVGGIGGCWWREDHNEHHAFPNALGVDKSAGAAPFLYIDARQAPLARRGSLTRLALRTQVAVYLPLCLLVARFNLHVVSLAASPAPLASAAFLADALGICAHFAWLAALLRHSACVSALEIFAVYYGANVACSILHLQLNLNHYDLAMDTLQESIAMPWCERQLRRSMNVSTYSGKDWQRHLSAWFYGGLEYQIEHHLFPRMPREHLAAVAPRVRALAAALGLPYRSEGFVQANLSALRALRRAAADGLAHADADAAAAACCHGEHVLRSSSKVNYSF